MADDRTDAPIIDEGEDAELSEFDPASLPLGTFAAFDVSDQPMWTTKEGSQNLINSDQKAAIRSMVDAVGRADSVARRIEVQGAWWLELLDRGMHRLKPNNDGGWDIYGGSKVTNGRGVYGSAMANNYYDTNVIGEKNDIIVSLLTRELTSSKFVPDCPGDPDDETYAASADSMRHFIADENKYGKRQAEVGRFFCTDERSVSYTRIVADAQRWGYEDNPGDVVPETADGLDPNAAGKASGKKPKMRAVTTIFGKLSHKCPIMAADQNAMQYQMIQQEIDAALARSKCPWIADQINGGDLGVAEIKMDRLARQSIRLAMQASTTAGDSTQRDVTETYCWFRPGFYMDDSCPKKLRAWFWQNFEKGMLVVYEAGVLAFVRNESMDECLNIFHARTGNGQNRRAITESYAGPQMRLNVLVDLWDEFCRKEVPRLGLDADVWDVPAVRSSSVRVGSIEPFKAPVGRPAADTIVQFPQPSHVPTMPDFIMWLAGPLAEQLTHATQGLAGSQDGKDPEQTATESKLKDNNAMGSFGESWKEMCEGFATIDTQAVAWVARVLPDNEKFDSNFPGKGRIRAEVQKLKMGSGKARAEGDANFPQSWAERESAWDKALADSGTNPIIAGIVSDPETQAGMKDFLPKGMVIPVAAAVEKQRGEFDVLLRTPLQDNPQYLKAQQMVQKLTPLIQVGTMEAQMFAQAGQQMDPQKAQQLQQAQQMLEQAQQALQTLPPKISSVPIFPNDNDAVESLICDRMINGPEGRRLGNSKDESDQAIYANLSMHKQQHDQAAKQKSMANVKPIPPKISINIPADKLNPTEQAGALALAGIPSGPDVEEGAMHEMSTTEKGVGPSGSEIERTVKVSGKPLN